MCGKFDLQLGGVCGFFFGERSVCSVSYSHHKVWLSLALAALSLSSLDHRTNERLAKSNFALLRTEESDSLSHFSFHSHAFLSLLSLSLLSRSMFRFLLFTLSGLLT